MANKLAYLGNGVALMPVTGLLDGSVYRTSDSGSSWSVISNGLFGFKQTIISIGVNQAAAIGNNLKNSHNLYLTTDGGITLAKKRGSFTPVDVRGVELLYIGEDVHPGIPGLYDE